MEASRANPDSIADHGIDDVTNHYASIIDELPARPILIGHSFGGMIAEKLLGMDYGTAAIGIDAAQIKGVLPLPLSALHATLPCSRTPPTSTGLSRLPPSSSITASAMRSARRSPASCSSDGRSRRPASRCSRPRWLTSRHSPAKVETGNEGRGPLLLIMGGQDHTVPEAITKSTVKQYRHSSAVTDLEEFKDRGHSLTIDGGWHEVADACLAWLGKQGL